MTPVSGIPYRRHGPTAALRQFLDPLDPGDYFDCGRARLHGLDDALLAEARDRGRSIGDDAFLLVATDMGLIFCRPSISFAIAARWEDLTLIRPRGDDPVVLPVTWPRHGELKFTLSKRLAGNIFRRWLQLRMKAVRRAREVETGQHPLFAPFEAGAATGPPAGQCVPSRSGAPLTGGRGPDTGVETTAGIGPDVGSVSVELVDEELDRVAVPDSMAKPAWVGSAASVAAMLVVLSSAVVAAALTVSVFRDGGQGGQPDGEVAGPSRTTVDHRRFRPASDGVGGLDGGADDHGPLSASAPGGASQAVPSSSQQLLSIPPDESEPDRARACSGNYGGCVPDVAEADGGDVDCPGKGDGPYFAEGEVIVLGPDVYGLDTDKDGVACEADQPDEAGQPGGDRRDAEPTPVDPVDESGDGPAAAGP